MARQISSIVPFVPYSIADLAYLAGIIDGEEWGVPKR